jgi:hypothetical protein
MDNEVDNQAPSTDINREEIDIWYRSNNIIREKSELYYDFISSLFKLIDETYLGSDIILSVEDMTNHFNWCYNKVISNFEQERIYFTAAAKTPQYEYLWFLFYKAYYLCNTEDKVQILDEYFKLLFDFNKLKTRTEIESFTELYKIFDQNLKKIN